jgi:hypothetical protein
MALEEPQYEVLTERAGYEIRRYAPYLVAEVDVGGRSADSEGFRTLAGYIFGDNEASEKMKMTAPVESREADDSNDITYAFVMESKYALDTVPKPNNERIQLRQKPSRVVAVRRFSGRWTEGNVAKHERQLLSALQADGITPLGTIELARYNSPFTPWFLRRNEVIVAIDWPVDTP